MIMMTFFNYTYLTEMTSLEMRPLEILGGYNLVFPNVSPLHFLLPLMGLVLIIIFFYIFVLFSSGDWKGIEVTEETEIHTGPNLPGQIEGPDDMEVHRPKPPISKVKKMVKKIKQKVKKWIKKKILISSMVEQDIPNIQIQVQILNENIPVY